MRLLRASLATLGCLLAAGLPGTGRAQDIGNSTTQYLETPGYREGLRTWDQLKTNNAERVTDRTREDYRPLGLMLSGGHLLFPSIDLSTTYDDNIYRLGDPDRVADLRYDVMPEIEFRSSLPRHMFNFRTGGRFAGFRDHEDLSYASGHAKIDWRLDIDSGNAIGGGILSEYGHEDRFEPDYPANVAGPIPELTNRVEFGYMHDRGRVGLTLGIDYTHEDFYDVQDFSGQTIDQDGRDRQTYGGFGLVTYRFSPGYNAFVAARGERIDFRLPISATFDANHYEGQVGLESEFNPLLRYKLSTGIGYMDYDDPDQPDITASLFKGEITWLPTPLATVVLTAYRSLDVTDQADARGRLTTSGAVRLYYDIRNDMGMQLDLGYQEDQYVGSERVDDILSGAAEYQYFMNKNLMFTFRYEHRQRDSNEDDLDYTDNRYTAAVKLSN